MRAPRPSQDSDSDYKAGGKGGDSDDDVMAHQARQPGSRAACGSSCLLVGSFCALGIDSERPLCAQLPTPPHVIAQGKRRRSGAGEGEWRASELQRFIDRLGIMGPGRTELVREQVGAWRLVFAATKSAEGSHGLLPSCRGPPQWNGMCASPRLCPPVPPRATAAAAAGRAQQAQRGGLP